MCSHKGVLIIFYVTQGEKKVKKFEFCLDSTEKAEYNKLSGEQQKGAWEVVKSLMFLSLEYHVLHCKAGN